MIKIPPLMAPSFRHFLFVKAQKFKTRKRKEGRKESEGGSGRTSGARSRRWRWRWRSSACWRTSCSSPPCLLRRAQTVAPPGSSPRRTSSLWRAVAGRRRSWPRRRGRRREGQGRSVWRHQQRNRRRSGRQGGNRIINAFWRFLSWEYYSVSLFQWVRSFSPRRRQLFGPPWPLAPVHHLGGADLPQGRQGGRPQRPSGEVHQGV